MRCGDAATVRTVLLECTAEAEAAQPCVDLFADARSYQRFRREIAHVVRSSCGDVGTVTIDEQRSSRVLYDSERGWFVGDSELSGRFVAERCEGSFELDLQTRDHVTTVSRIRIGRDDEPESAPVVAPRPSPTSPPTSRAATTPSKPAPSRPSRPIGDYCEEVYRPMNALLAGYPFAATGTDASRDRVTELLAPSSGRLWTYYRAVLAKDVMRDGNSFTLGASVEAAPGSIDPRMVRFLDRALDLSRSLFPGRDDRMSVELTLMIRPHPKVPTTVVEIDGDRFDFYDAPDHWRRFVWPIEDGNPVGRITARALGSDDRFGQDTAWGPFRLFEDGTIASGGSGARFTVSYPLSTRPGPALEVQVRPGNPDINPFFGAADAGRAGAFMELFRHPDLVPPPAVVLGAPGCE